MIDWNGFGWVMMALCATALAVALAVHARRCCGGQDDTAEFLPARDREPR